MTVNCQTYPNAWSLALAILVWIGFIFVFGYFGYRYVRFSASRAERAVQPDSPLNRLRLPIFTKTRADWPYLRARYVFSGVCSLLIGSFLTWMLLVSAWQCGLRPFLVKDL